jgi:hypothetical protein
MPEHLLDAMLGTVIGAAGLVYVLSFFIDLPFKL